jgi:hypothetical protein
MSREVDLANLKDCIRLVKCGSYETLKFLAIEGGNLKDFGYNTIEEATIDIIKSAEKSIKAVTNEYLKKYPE